MSVILPGDEYVEGGSRTYGTIVSVDYSLDAPTLKYTWSDRDYATSYFYGIDAWNTLAYIHRRPDATPR